MDSIRRIGLFTNNYVDPGIAATIALQLCIVVLPSLNRLFHTQPLDAADWIAPVENGKCRVVTRPGARGRGARGRR